jgi:AcrR family transcriptional regulator
MERNVRAVLLRCVGELVREHGVGFVSLREVARRARVSHGAPAKHFRNKAGMLTAFATEGYTLLAETVAAEMTRAVAGDPRAQLSAVGRGYVRFAVKHRAHFEIMFRLDWLDKDNEAFVAAGEAAYALLSTKVAACDEAGLLAGSSPEIVAVAAWSMMHGLAALWIGGRLQGRLSIDDSEVVAGEVARLFVERVLRTDNRTSPKARRRRRSTEAVR